MTTHVQEWQECSVCGWYTAFVDGAVKHLGVGVFTHEPQPQAIPEPVRCSGCSHLAHGAGECGARPMFTCELKCRCPEASS